MHCSACGAACPDDAHFCPHCGARHAAHAPAIEQLKTVTALFCDVTGSTTPGERLDPVSIRRVLARFFDLARSTIQSHGLELGASHDLSTQPDARIVLAEVAARRADHDQALSPAGRAVEPAEAMESPCHLGDARFALAEDHQLARRSEARAAGLGAVAAYGGKGATPLVADVRRRLSELGADLDPARPGASV